MINVLNQLRSGTATVSNKNAQVSMQSVSSRVTIGEDVLVSIGTFRRGL